MLKKTRKIDKRAIPDKKVWIMFASEPNHRILLVGDMKMGSYGWGFSRSAERLGFCWSALTEPLLLSGLGFPGRGLRRLGVTPDWLLFNLMLQYRVRVFSPDVVIVLKGIGLWDTTLRNIGKSSKLVLCMNDDFMPRQPVFRIRQIQRQVPLYDLVVTQRPHRKQVIEQFNPKNLLFQEFAYFPDLHYPVDSVSKEYKTDLVFVGSFEPARLSFMEALVSAGLKLHIWGSGWTRYRARLGMSVYGREARGLEYTQVLAGAKIAICLIQSNNFDYHSMRTFEIPAIGSFMLAQRTPDHTRIFEEGQEIACFDTPEELVAQATYYLSHENERCKMAGRAHNKVAQGLCSIDDRFSEIVLRCDEIAPTIERVVRDS